MAMEFETGVPRSVGRKAVSGWTPWLVLGALSAVAMLMRSALSANTDVSWLLTVGERVLDGQQLYRDVIETNPPKAVLVYMPGIAIARVLGLSVERVTDALVFAAIAASLACVARLLKGSSVIAGVGVRALAYLAIVVLAILPTREFAQREHIAMLEVLPAMAVLAMRLKRETPPLWGVVIAGLGLGLSLSFKPYFAIAFLGALVVLAVYLKSWRPLLAPEYVVAAGVIAAYVAVVVVAFPDYLTVIGPLARDVYVPAGLSMVEMLQKPAALPWAIATIAACALMRRREADVVFLLLVVMSVCFAAVFFLQRKGWSYHAYPMIAFAVLALGYAIARNDTDRMTAIGGTTLIAMVVALTMIAFNDAFDAKPLEAAVARLGPNPKLLAITSEPGLGHPLTREVGGTWVSRQQGLWVAGYSSFLRQRSALDADRAATMNAYAARERDWLIADIRKTPPDVVLIDNLTGRWGAWAAADAELSALLAPYTRKQTLNGIDILSKPD